MLRLRPSAGARTPAAFDVLGFTALIVGAALIGLLAVTPGGPVRTGLLVAVGVAGLILLRQHRKATMSAATSEAKAKYAASHDPLTSLPNTAGFLERLAAAGPLRPGATLLHLRIDRYDELVDAQGHAEADAAVLRAAGRLSAACGDSDVVARVGDDAFAVFCRAGERAEALAGEFVRLLSAPAPGAVPITASVGVKPVVEAGESPAECLRQAAVAMSAARRRGGDRACVFSPELDRTLQSRKALEADLRAALEAGELDMLYQPQVNGRQQLVGVEALMRWTHPERGAIAPSVFVPLAEACGLGPALGRYALRRALEDSRRWPGLKVAVNITAPQVQSGDLVPYLQALCPELGVSPKCIELELTEGVLLADEAATYATLNALRRMGFSLALDDFGTGYSSLSYLRQFPIDKIKIDRAFVAHLGVRPESDAIVKAIIDMAQALELRVLAEGVETQSQVDRLAAAGCTNIQGFWFSRPVDAAAIDAMVAAPAKKAA